MRLQKLIRLSLGSRILAIKVNIWNQELHNHYGITNETSDGKYIPFWDFVEDIPIEYIYKALRSIQMKHLLGDIYVLQTYPKESYRAFSLDPMPFQFFVSILAGTRYIDINYLKHSVIRGRAVIRITEKDGTKNILIKRLSCGGETTRSPHHEAFFNAIYPEVHLSQETSPNPIKVAIHKYESFR